MNQAATELLQPWLTELVLAAGGVVLLAGSRVRVLAERAGELALLVLAASAVAAVYSMDALQGPAAGGLLSVDPFGAYFKFVASMTALAAVWLSTRAREAGDGTPVAWALLAASLLGMSVMVSATHVLAAWAGFEIATLSAALWIVARPDSGKHASTALVMLLEGAAASALMLLGFALLFGLAGTFSYQDLAGRLAAALAAPGGRHVLVTALVLVLAGALWRLAVVPWERSRVEGAAGVPVSVLAYLAVAPAIATLAVLVRFLRGAVSGPASDGHWGELPGVEWAALLSIVAMVTMTIGNVAALREASLRRLVAWLSVSQAGFLLIGLVVRRDAAVEAMLFHAVAYALATFGLLATLAPVVEQAGTDDFEVLRGLARRRGSARALAFAFAVFVLSLAGVPLVVGYEGRTMLLTELMRAGGAGLAAVAAASSAVGLLVVIRIVATLLDSPHDADENVTVDFEASVLAGLLLIGTVGLGVWPGALLAFAGRSVVFFGG